MRSTRWSPVPVAAFDRLRRRAGPRGLIRRPVPGRAGNHRPRRAGQQVEFRLQRSGHPVAGDDTSAGDLYGLLQRRAGGGDLRGIAGSDRRNQHPVRTVAVITRGLHSALHLVALAKQFPPPCSAHEFFRAEYRLVGRGFHAVRSAAPYTSPGHYRAALPRRDGSRTPPTVERPTWSQKKVATVSSRGSDRQRGGPRTTRGLDLFGNSVRLRNRVMQIQYASPPQRATGTGRPDSAGRAVIYQASCSLRTHRGRRHGGCRIDPGRRTRSLQCPVSPRRARPGGAAPGDRHGCRSTVVRPANRPRSRLDTRRHRRRGILSVRLAGASGGSGV